MVGTAEQLRESLQEFADSIGWGYLRDQKAVLQYYIAICEIDHRIDPEHSEAFRGLLHLVDAVQDFVISSGAKTAREVFLLEDDEEGCTKEG